MSADGLRPRLHLTADSGWVNDPLGLTFRDGRYHLFFQHVPASTVWAPECHWGHATSDDLVTWSEREVALAPGGGDDGCWSGSIAVTEDGEAVLFYTSVTVPDINVGRVRTARPADGSWDRWVKQDVVARLPDGVDAVTFRDPYVLRDGHRWRMLVGAGLADGTATALGYVSDDLETWTYDGPLAARHTSQREPVWTGGLWECPQLFELDGRWVLVVSVWEADVLHYVACAVGDLSDGRFEARTWQRLTYGPCYYAASAFADEDARRGLVVWLQGVRDPAGAWAGALSVPHLLSLDGDTVVSSPHPHVDGYRAGGPAADSVRVHAADIEWTPGGAGRLTLQDAAGATPVVVECGAGELVLTCSGTQTPWRMPWTSGTVRVLLDGPVLELFAPAGVMAVPVERTGGPLGARAEGGDLRWWSLDAG